MKPFLIKKTYLLILLGFIFPPLMYVSFQQSSNAAGVLGVAIFALFFYTKSIPSKVHYRFLVVFLCVFVYCILTFANNGDFFKAIISLFMFFCLLIVYGSLLTDENFGHDIKYIKTVKLCYFFIVLLGFLSLNHSFVFFGYENKPANVFPFSEPSHYSIAYCFFAFMYQFYVRKNKGLHTFLITATLGVLFPNLTMIVVALLLFLALKVRLKLFVSVVLLLIMLPIIIFYFSEYFLSRLIFDSEKLNLSNLVYFQGWESAWIALKETNGLGVGFQSLGIQSPGFYTELIRSVMDGYDLNRNDGGFLAAKFIGEFGVLGIIVSSAVLVNSLRVLYAANTLNYNQQPLAVMYMALSMGMIVEFFIRGFGYFSPAFVIFSTFILYKPGFFKSKILLH